MNNISVRINNTDTQDNANGLYIRILETDEITDIYNEHIVTDFPASDVKKERARTVFCIWNV